MNEIECSVSSASADEKKKLMNAQTQFGKPEENADDENIILWKRSFSPERETANDGVWNEELVETSEQDVSKLSLLKIYVELPIIC